MKRRTTIELDEELLSRAKRALGQTTTRGTVEEALRRAAAEAEDELEESTARQRRYIQELPARVDLDVLVTQEMWR
jgi:Arc/MetJ family transcription regulator